MVKSNTRSELASQPEILHYSQLTQFNTTTLHRIVTHSLSIGEFNLVSKIYGKFNPHSHGEVQPVFIYSSALARIFYIFS